MEVKVEFKVSLKPKLESMMKRELLLWFIEYYDLF